MKLQYSHGKNVVPFFYEIVDLLLEKDGRIYLNDAHNLAPLHRMKVAEGSLVIQKLALEKWLKVDRSMDDAYLIFGVRSLLELPRVRNWIMKRNLSRTAGNKATGDDSDIEKEENELAESQEVGESSMASRKRKLSRSSRIKEVESDDDDMEVDEEPKAAPTRSTRSTRSRSRP